ncbi:hypothetical protein M427DRAFT_154244 [Gonapodya prolifera JEL478]|uniref:Uncharacterized protein n=1 Tax=Gonapodya prolifera (strain JEL478) TaxID=1344416 RepID=A0A139AJ75_GONPJ|nr:hypothetical protein M427DRAFT_154244 [Gonapodya prolifera JEL478]|eukprot:KXS16846.1 hypothetical protein M427DRAFT_154244 [Gonapodya prolifera JEL478]
MIRCCVMLFMPIMFLLLLLAGIHYLLATTIGDVCFYVFEQRLAPLTPIIDAVMPGSNISVYASVGFQTIDACVSGTKTLDIVRNLSSVLGLDANTTAYLNLSRTITQTLDALNLQQALGGAFNFNQMVNLGVNVTQAVEPWNAANPTGFNFGSISLSTMSTSGLTSLSNGLNAKAGSGAGSLASGDFTWNPAYSGSNAQTTLLDSFKASVAAVATSVDTLKNGDVAALNTLLSVDMTSQKNTLSTKVTTLNTDITNLVAKYNDIMTLLNNFGTGASANLTRVAIPAIYSNFLTLADRSTDSLNNATSCEILAKDFLAIENGLCVGLVGGFDAIWFSFFIEGIVLVFGIPIYVVVANRLAYDGPAVSPGAVVPMSLKDGKGYLDARSKILKSRPDGPHRANSTKAQAEDEPLLVDDRNPRADASLRGEQRKVYPNEY